MESGIAWRIAHGVVKTRAYLKSWRRLAVSDQWAGCGEIETISHAFCARNLLSPVWSWVSKLINKFYDSPVLLTNPIVLLQQGLPQVQQFFLSNALSSFLIKLTLNELWAARNLDTFESKRPSVRTIIAQIKARIRHRIRPAFHIAYLTVCMYVISFALKESLLEQNRCSWIPRGLDVSLFKLFPLAIYAPLIAFTSYQIIHFELIKGAMTAMNHPLLRNSSPYCRVSPTWPIA